MKTARIFPLIGFLSDLCFVFYGLILIQFALALTAVPLLTIIGAVVLMSLTGLIGFFTFRPTYQPQRFVLDWFLLTIGLISAMATGIIFLYFLALSPWTAGFSKVLCFVAIAGLAYAKGREILMRRSALEVAGMPSFCHVLVLMPLLFFSPLLFMSILLPATGLIAGVWFVGAVQAAGAVLFFSQRSAVVAEDENKFYVCLYICLLIFGALVFSFIQAQAISGFLFHLAG